MADRSRAAATHRRTTSLFGESEVPLISRKAARSRVEVELIDAELEMIWLTEVDEGEDHGNEEGLDALCDIEQFGEMEDSIEDAGDLWGMSEEEAQLGAASPARSSDMPQGRGPGVDGGGAIGPGGSASSGSASAPPGGEAEGVQNRSHRGSLDSEFRK